VPGESTNSLGANKTDVVVHNLIVPSQLDLYNKSLVLAIGEVAVASGAQEELLRSALAGLTDVTFTYIVFEGVGADQSASMLKAFLGELYFELERHGPNPTYIHNTSVPYKPHEFLNSNYLDVMAVLSEIRVLRELRNNVIHSVWRRQPWSSHAGIRPRPWGEKSLAADVFYCHISKLRKMWTYQAFTPSDIHELATRINSASSRLAAHLRLVFAELTETNYVEASEGVLSDWP
jgi:hypothetical protein